MHARRNCLLQRDEWGSQEEEKMAFDLLIKNGRVVDGLGERSYMADVAVQGGRIVGVGKSNGAAAKRIINAEGRVVAPGFIDHHNHFDCQAVWDPLCNSSVQNGHTMIILGMCGQVIAPVRPGDGEWYLEFFSEAEAIPLSAIKAGVDVTWESIAEYFEALGRRRGVNVGALIGHSGIRRYVMGEAAATQAAATAEELATMQWLVREGMQAGALGFSTAPARRRDPAGAASEEERYALAGVLAELGTGMIQVSGGAPGGTKASHLLARELSSRTGRPAVYNLLSQSIEDPEMHKEHLQWLADSFKAGARAYGSCTPCVQGPIFDLRLGLDVPQDEDLTNPNGIFNGMPTWDNVMSRPYRERMAAFRDPETRKALSAEAVEGAVAQAAPMTDRRGQARGYFNRRWDLVQVFLATTEKNQALQGKSVEQIAKEQGKNTIDAFLDLSVDEELQTLFQVVERGTDPKAQKEILGSPFTVIGTSDGGARPHSHDRDDYPTNLLGRWVREEQVMSLEEAVYRLTGKTALQHDLADRGFVAPGKVADITIFDPDTIASKPRKLVSDLPDGGARVDAGAIGIDHVIVNGVGLMENGEHTGAFPGQIVRGAAYQGPRA
jgi:N-acyl-D-amino-acid deacylase